MATAKAVRVLFDAQEYQRLELLAKSRGASVAALVRKAVEQQYLQPSVLQKQAALEHLLAQTLDFSSWEEVKKEIEQEKIRGLETA